MISNYTKLHVPIIRNTFKLWRTKEDDIELSKLIECSTDKTLSQVTSLASRNRVLIQVWDVLKHYVDKGSFRRVDEYVLQKRRLISFLNLQAKATFSSLQDARVPFVAIKGIALDDFYPKEIPREKNDIDIIVKDWPNIWKCLNILNGSGGGPNILSIRALRDHQLQFGGEARNLGDFGFPGHLMIDLHFGALPIISGKTYGSHVWKNIRFHASSNGSFPIPSPEDSLLLVCAHAYHHGVVIMRDLNDVAVILKDQDSQLNWDFVLRTSKTENFLPLLFQILKKVKTIYPDIQEIEEIMNFRCTRSSLFMAKMLIENKWPKPFWSFSNIFFHSIFYQIDIVGVWRGLFEAIAGILYEIENMFSRKAGFLWWLGYFMNLSLGKPRKRIKIDGFRYTELARIACNCDEFANVKNINIGEASDMFRILGYQQKWIGEDILLLELKRGIELVITPNGLYAKHNRYLKGFLSWDKSSIENEARQICKKLVEAKVADVG